VNNSGSLVKLVFSSAMMISIIVCVFAFYTQSARSQNLSNRFGRSEFLRKVTTPTGYSWVGSFNFGYNAYDHGNGGLEISQSISIYVSRETLNTDKSISKDAAREDCLSMLDYAANSHDKSSVEAILFDGGITLGNGRAQLDRINSSGLAVYLVPGKGECEFNFDGYNSFQITRILYAVKFVEPIAHENDLDAAAKLQSRAQREVVPPTASPSPTCTPASLLGDWIGAIKDDGAGGLAGGTGRMVNQGLRFTSAGQEVAVEFSDGRYRMGWERRGILKLDPAAASAGQCRFQVLNNFSVAGRASLDLASSKLTYSNSQGVLQSLDGFVRGTVPPPELTCTPKDVEGTWIRGSDGARVGLGGMNFQGGGIGTVVSHPDPRWPKGSSKFKSVTQIGSTCVYNAKCVTTHANDQGGYIFTDEACTLTLDRAASSLTASAGHGVYSLNSPQ